MKARHKFLLLVLMGMFLAILFGYSEARAERKYQCTLETYPTSLPEDQEAVDKDQTYIILKDPILVQLDDGVAMVYKIRITDVGCRLHGMIDIVPYHEEARQVLGTKLRIPLYNVRCIITGPNSIKGHRFGDIRR